jgi:hypothetical protein
MIARPLGLFASTALAAMTGLSPNQAQKEGATCSVSFHGSTIRTSAIFSSSKNIMHHVR